MNWQYLINPFLKFPERILFLTGLLSILAGSLFGSYFGVTYKGAFDAKSAETTFISSLGENAVNIAVIFGLLFILGKIINSKTRAIDILNISMIYRIPIYFTALFVNIPLLGSISERVMANMDHPENIKFDTLELAVLLVISSALILLLVYAVILLVNGFRTATNLKKWQYYVAFTFVLLIAELLSTMIIINLH